MLYIISDRSRAPWQWLTNSEGFGWEWTTRKSDALVFQTRHQAQEAIDVWGGRLMEVSLEKS